MKNFNHSLIFLLVLLLTAGSINFAQANSTISTFGQVVDAKYNTPLIGAQVAAPELGIGATTDENGLFTIGFPKSGSYTLQVSYVGYKTVTDTIVTGSDKTYTFSLDKDPAGLPEVVVTSPRYAVNNFYAPNFFSTMPQREIRIRGGRTAPELLIGALGVWVQKTNHGGGSPFIRGLTGNQTLTLLDGIRLNNATYRYGPNQYFNTLDALGIANVEVMMGAGSVLYGSDALGGAVNVLTKTPQFSPNGWRFGGSLTSRFMTGDMEKTGLATVRASGEKMAFHASFSYRDFGDLIAGGDLGKEAPSSYNETAGNFKSLFKAGARGVLTLAYNSVRQSDVGRYDQVAQRGYELYQFNPQNRDLGYMKYQFSTESDWIKEVKLVASFQKSLEGRQKKKVDAPILQEETDKVNTLGLSAEIHSSPVDALRMTTGVEYYRDKVKSGALDKEVATGTFIAKRGLYPDGSRAENLAVYTSHTLKAKRFQFNVGGRFNVVRIAIEDEVFGNTNIAPSAFVWNASTRYALHKSHALFFNMFTGFRTPNINDLSSFGSFDFGVEVPSFGLQPEKSFTLETGYKLSAKRLEANVSAYSMRLTNLITRVRGAFNGLPAYNGEDVYTKENTAKAIVQGVESRIKASISPQLSFSTNLTYTYGQDQTKGEPMRRIPPMFGRTALMWQHKSGFYAQAEHLFAGAQTRLSGGDIDDHRIQEGGTPGWNVVNLNAGYEWNWLAVNLGLQNLMNEAYRIHGSGVDGVGRNLWISISVKL